MALKYIPQSWKDDMRVNYNHRFNFYINPRGRVLPALTSAGVSYIKNSIPENMRGTYRMQCGASTNLTYLYTLPQRFIIEGWFKPEFAYDVASYQLICGDTSPYNALIAYNSTNDTVYFYTNPGTNISTTAFTSTISLQKWVYVRCFFDNVAKLKGFYCTVNGVTYADSQNVPGAGAFVPLNTISFMPTVAAESSYWIIHELDETLPTGEYKTYQADRQVIFDFNGTTLGRERIRIPVVHDPSDHRGVKAFSFSKSVENLMTGSAGANTASMTLLNTNGQFSDDQYDAFDPFNGRYNGTQKYLQNRVCVEIESVFSRTGSAEDIPNGTTPTYMGMVFIAIDAGWLVNSGSPTSSFGKGLWNIVANGTSEGYYRSILAGQKWKIKIRVNSGSVSVNIQSGGSVSYTATSDKWIVYSINASSNSSVRMYSDSADWDVEWCYIGDGTELTDQIREPVFMGRTTPGAFKRSSPDKFQGEVSIDIEDGISELGETKLSRAYGFDSYDISDPAVESDSLFHSIARLVTVKEVREYLGNSSVENATIANSWTNAGMATFERSNTYAQFGTYSMKCIADAIGDKVSQRVTFVGDDKMDVDDVFNFAVYIRQGTASAVKITIEETDSGGTIIGTASETACGADTANFTRVNVSRTILSSSCVGLRVALYAVATSTFYADGFMLTRGIDPVDWNIVNANDGTSGVISADSYTAGTYDTVAIDADAVDIEHPYALVEKGATAWEALKQIGDASIAAYTGMTPDGVLEFRVRYNGDDMENLGDIEDFGGIATSLDVKGANSIKVHGVIIKNPETNTTNLWEASTAAGFSTDEGGKLNHPITSATFMQVYGAEEIEMKYSEDV